MLLFVAFVQCNNCPTDQTGGYLCQSQLQPETAVSLTNQNSPDVTTTGGGFSLVFPMPSYQTSVVNNYLAKCNTNTCKLPASSQFNANNRAYPDVAAFGGYFGIVVNGQESVLTGTSVAAPIWAGLMARLNEAMLSKYGRTIGLSQPLLYNMSLVSPSTFHDITTGNNICPRNNAACVSAVRSGSTTSCQGFQGAAGWDPVTGLGSPNIGNMLAFIQNNAVPSGDGSSGALIFASTGRNGAAATASSGGLLGLMVCVVLAAVMQFM